MIITQRIAIVLALSSMAFGTGALAQEAGSARESGPKMNQTVFRAGAIVGVTAVTRVFGRSQRVTATIVEFDRALDSGKLRADSFRVDGRTIQSVKVTSRPDPDATAANGRFVTIALDPADAAAAIFAPGVDEAAQLVVFQTAPITLADGGVAAAPAKGVINTAVTNLIVDDFRQYRFTDPVTGLTLDYNLFVPRNHDPNRRWPLVLFLHDAGVTGSNPLRTLKQGLGAVSFASREDQARHPAFVVAPQFPVALTNDASQTSVYVDMIPRLLDQLAREYAIDRDRIHTTGQSGGCMTSIALNVAHPDLFAGTLCVAGQWDPSVVAPLARKNFWAIVSEDDAKAYPGMTAIMARIEANGAKVARATLDARASPERMAADVAAIRAANKGDHVFFTLLAKGSVLPAGDAGNPGAGHVNTWIYAYDIPAVRDWLLEQRR